MISQYAVIFFTWNTKNCIILVPGNNIILRRYFNYQVINTDRITFLIIISQECVVVILNKNETLFDKMITNNFINGYVDKWIHSSYFICTKIMFYVIYSGFQIDELHHHNQNLVGRLHKGVPTVLYQHENCCKSGEYFGKNSNWWPPASTNSLIKFFLWISELSVQQYTGNF